jgi:hypothetical protein
MQISLQITLAAETHLVDELTLKLLLTTKVEKSLILLKCIRKLTVPNMEEQLILFLNTSIRKRASRCFRLEWSVEILSLGSLPSSLLQRTPAKNLLWYKVANFFNSFEFGRISRCNGVPGNGCIFQFGSYKGGIQNRKAMRTGERRGNIMNQAQNF